MVCHLASVLRCTTWCALLLTFGCANAAQETEFVRARDDDQHATSSAGQPSGNSSHAAEPTWCAARAVLERNCQRCHGAKPSNGAPFSLVTYDDTQASNKKGKARFEAIAQVVASELMPPTYLELEPPVAALQSEDRELLLAWCEQGAPGSASDDCVTAD